MIKGYHAEEREEKIFAGGVRRLLDNVMRTLTATSLMGLSASVLLGVVGAATMYVGGRQMVAHTLTAGSYFSYNFLLVFLIAPIMQVVSIGTQLTEALAGLERTQEIMRERPEDLHGVQRVENGLVGAHDDDVALFAALAFVRGRRPRLRRSSAST